ncbi:MAG: IS1595 family transposase [Chitinophagales bacterium]
MKFKNLIDVITHFSDKKVATEHLVKLRWNGKPTCPFCNSEKVSMLKGNTQRFKCYQCREQFSATKGTIFENSAVPLQKWFAAIYLITSHKKGISSLQLHRDLGITQKTAWFMLQRIRFALKSGSFIRGNNAIVDMDETFMGGTRRNMHKGKGKELAKLGEGYVAQTMVVGMLSRGVGVKATVRKGNPTQKVLHGVAKEHLNNTTTLTTDGHGGYRGLNAFCKHEVIEHAKDEYVRGEYHTNGIEGFEVCLIAAFAAYPTK